MNAAQNDYIRRITSYLSFHSSDQRLDQTRDPVKAYPKLHGEFITTYPPQGATVRELYQEGASSDWNSWKVPDKQRHVRELQGVKCKQMFAQDHTHEVTKNYQKKVGGFAMWDVSTETGEIASVVMVPDT